MNGKFPKVLNSTAYVSNSTGSSATNLKSTTRHRPSQMLLRDPSLRGQVESSRHGCMAVTLRGNVLFS